MDKRIARANLASRRKGRGRQKDHYLAGCGGAPGVATGRGLIRVRAVSLRRKRLADGAWLEEWRAVPSGSRTRRSSRVLEARPPSLATGPGSCAVPSSTARRQCWPPPHRTDKHPEATPRPSSQAELRDNAAPCKLWVTPRVGGDGWTPPSAPDLCGGSSCITGESEGCGPLGFGATAEQR